MDALSKAVSTVEKQILVIDALRAADYRCEANAVFLQIFFDYLVIYFHGAVMMTLRSNNPTSVCCSLSDLDRKCPAYFQDTLCQTFLFADLTLEVTPLVASRAEIRDAPFVHSLLSKYHDRLKAGIPDYNKIYRTRLKKPTASVDRQQLLTPLRSQLDNVYRDIHMSRMLGSPDKGEIAPIFAVARHPSVTTRQLNGVALPYTPHLLLSDKQGSILQEKNRGTPNALNKVEETLEDNRSQADSPLLSGTVDLMEESGPRNSHGPKESQPLEKILYSQLCGGSPYFFVPIHIGNIPWLCFFTVQNPDSQKQWLRLYHFYRDALPYLGGAVTAGVYNSLAASLVSKALNKYQKHKLWSKAVPEINSDWEALLAHFPFFESVSIGVEKDQPGDLKNEPLVTIKALTRDDNVRTENCNAFADRIKSDLTKTIFGSGIDQDSCYILEIDGKRRLYIPNNSQLTVLDIDRLEKNSDKLWKDFERAQKKVSEVFKSVEDREIRKQASGGGIRRRVTVPEVNGELAGFLLAGHAVILRYLPTLNGKNHKPRKFLWGISELFKEQNGTIYLRSLLGQRQPGSPGDLYPKYLSAYEMIDPRNIESNDPLKPDNAPWGEFPVPHGRFLRSYIWKLWKEKEEEFKKKRI